MEVTPKHLHQRYSSMDTEELADSYHAGGLTDLAVSVVKEVITSRGLDWAQFTKLPTTERESEPRSDWELWKSESGRLPSDARKQDDVETQRSVTKSDWKQQVVVIVLWLIMGAGLLWMLLPLADPAASPMDILAPWWPLFVIAAALLAIAMEAVKNSICPACRRWFAFKRTGNTRVVSENESESKEAERICKNCGHRNWVETSESGAGGT